MNASQGYIHKYENLKRKLNNFNDYIILNSLKMAPVQGAETCSWE
jgi:hypothetical protein